MIFDVIESLSMSSQNVLQFGQGRDAELCFLRKLTQLRVAAAELVDFWPFIAEMNGADDHFLSS